MPAFQLEMTVGDGVMDVNGIRSVVEGGESGAVVDGFLHILVPRDFHDFENVIEII